MEKEIEYYLKFNRVLVFCRYGSIISYFLIGIEQKIPIIVAGCISIISGCIALFCGEENYGKIKGENILYILHTQAKEFFRQKKIVTISFENHSMSYTISCICIILAGLCNRNCQDKIEYLSFFYCSL